MILGAVYWLLLRTKLASFLYLIASILSVYNAHTFVHKPELSLPLFVIEPLDFYFPTWTSPSPVDCLPNIPLCVDESPPISNPYSPTGHHQFDCLAWIPVLLLGFSLMREAWWTFFRFLRDLLHLLIVGPALLLILTGPHQAYTRDLRLTSRLPIDQSLVGTFHVPTPIHQHVYNPISNYNLYQRALLYHVPKVEPYVKKPPPEPIYTTEEWASDFDRAAHYNPYFLPSQIGHLKFENYYGMSRDQAYTYLDELMNPLEWYHLEQALIYPSIHSSREHHLLERAYVATTKLYTLLGYERHPFGFYQGIFLSDNFESQHVPIVCDTGSSFSLTPFLSDFVSELEPSDISKMHGLKDSVMIKGVGWVEWTIRDAFGQAATVKTRAYYIPEAKIRLFSPQVYFGLYQKGHAYFDHKRFRLNTANSVELEFPYECGSNQPLMFLDHQCAHVGIDGPLRQALNETDLTSVILSDLNINLKGPARELLLWHHRLCHVATSWVQSLMRPLKGEFGTSSTSLIPTKYQQTKSIETPKCPACQLAKQKRTSTGSQSVHNKPDRIEALTRDAKEPGAQVHLDHYISTTPGRLPHTFGKERQSEKYHGGTFFVDSATRYTKARHQVTTTTGETLASKREFEREAADLGVKIRSYRADNLVFDSELFTEDVQACGQTIDYSGVGAHHQNGVAERAIQTITNWARAMMMHQLIHWPEQFSPDLWPFAIDQAVHIWNNLPRTDTGLTPLEMFSGQTRPTNGAIQRARVWGCPVYVLDPTLQDQKKIPKWNPRSRLGVYLGCSPSHHNTVGRILNPTTGYISPQFHVAYDEKFETVFGTLTDRVFDAEFWTKLILSDAIDQRLTDYDLEHVDDPRSRDVVTKAHDLFDDFIHEDDDDSTSSSTSSSSAPEGEDPFSTGCGPVEREVSEGAIDVDMDPDYITRSGRRVKRVKYSNLLLPGQPTNLNLASRYKPYVEECYMAGGNPHRKFRANQLQDADLHAIKWNPATFLCSSRHDTRQALKALLSSQEEGYGWHHQALAAKGEDPEFNPTYEQAMNGPLADGYWEAAKKEIATLVAMDVWEVVDRQPWMNVLPAVWAFKKKVYPNGLVRKLKARLCVGGHKQQAGKDFWSTFAPTVSWTTVRLLLILSAQLQLATRQVDYTAAFVHADIDTPPGYDDMSEEDKAQWGVFVEMPRGFPAPGKVLKLKKSLYGLKQSPRNFFLHLKNKLELVGFEQATEIDPCLFISDKVICLVYVDDTLLFAHKMEDIDEALDKLVNAQGMALEIEDDVAGFLGVHIARDKHSGEIELTQRGLIDRIVQALGVSDVPTLTTPANDVLGSDELGDPPAGTFNYASVIGMLWYVYGHSRPDIGYAVSSAARFAFTPKRSHEEALMRIGRYLRGTRDRGLRLKPIVSKDLKLDVYVDSDFMGQYGKERRDNPDNVKSRAGHVIRLNECPIIWSSKLQQQISLSTMMAEYYALSDSMKEVLPLLEVTKAVAHGLGVDDLLVTEFRTTIWEDNMGALTLAQLEPGQHTVRSRYYDVRVHWFRQIIHAPKSNMLVQKIDTKEQLADLFTKPLPESTFCYLRKKLMGW